MKESVFGEKETENLNAEYKKSPAQLERVEQAVLYYILECCKISIILWMKRITVNGKTFLTS